MFKSVDEHTKCFIETLQTDYEEITKLFLEFQKKKKHNEEIITLWKKKVMNKKKDHKELENKLLNLDLEEKTLLAEQEDQREEEREREEKITHLKQEICDLTVEKKRLEIVYQDSKEQASKTFKALVAAMSFYKQYMKCYIDIDKSDSTICSFYFFYDEDKPLKEHTYYTTLEYQDEQWKVIKIEPSIPCEKEISTYLKKTGDIVSFISHVHNVCAELTENT